MPVYLLPEENYDGDLSITVVETVGIERDVQSLSGCVDFQESLYSKSSTHAGSVVHWNHTFTFGIVPGQSYQHLAQIDGSKNEIAKTHINQSSLQCEDKQVHEGTVGLCFPLIVDDEEKMLARVRESNLRHHQANAHGVSDENAVDDSDEHRIDMRELHVQRGKESARAFPEMKTIVTPQKPKAASHQFSLRVTPQNTAVASSTGNQFMAQQQAMDNSTARLAHHTHNTLGNVHSSGLFASPSLLYAEGPNNSHNKSKIAMKKASVQNQLNNTSENTALPKGEAPLLYIDIPSFMRVSIQWKPRWVENRAKDIMYMVNKGRGWSKSDANEWLKVCNMPYPCDYLWNRIESGHNWYVNSNNNNNNSNNNNNNNNSNKPPPHHSNSESNNGIELVPVVKRRNSILLKQPILSPKSTEFAPPLHVLSFLMTFNNSMIVNMHRLCALKYCSNNYPPNTLPSKQELLRARQIIAGLIDEHSQTLAVQPEPAQTPIKSRARGLQTPSRTPHKTETYFSKTNQVLPMIQEQDPTTPIKKTYATPQAHSQQPKKGILGLRK